MASHLASVASVLSLLSIALVLILLFSINSIPFVTRLCAVLIAAGLLVLAGLVWLFLRSSTSASDGGDMETGAAQAEPTSLEDGVGPTRFNYTELARATDNFHDSRKLGQGGFGAVYLGSLRGSEVAIKRIVQEGGGERSFMAEVKTIGQLNQKNLVRLLGWCRLGNRFFVVYEYMLNRSLDRFLFRGAAGDGICQQRRMLSWATRHSIILGVASALKYLHEDLRECVVHRDIKAANVMLDADFNARLGDFGLARSVEHGKSVVTTQNAGTVEYMAPEVLQRRRRPSKESDVYSWGVVALEVACGRRASSQPEQEDERLAAWVRRLHGRGELLRAADAELGGRFDEGQMRRLLAVGLMCTLQDRHKRPSISQVIHYLHPEASMPEIPEDTPPLPSPVISVPQRVVPPVTFVPPITSSIHDVGR